MKLLEYTLQFTLLSFLIGCSQPSPNSKLYIDEDKPLLEPKKFAKSFISKDSISEFGSVFNENNTEFYFAIDSAGKSKIKYTSLKKDQWTKPQTIITHSEHSFNDPFLSPNEKKLYYISDKPRSTNDTIKDYDIWYSEREGDKWSKPINAGMSINSDADEYYVSFNSKGSMYFSSNRDKDKKRQYDFDIYKSDIVDEMFQTPQKLNDSINTKRYEADVFISPDESYIIFCSTRKSSYGRGDLYISFKNDNENWTKSVNMGRPINSEGHELCPFVTKDGKYLFYTSNQDIYWVSTKIIDKIRSSLNQ